MLITILFSDVYPFDQFRKALDLRDDIYAFPYPFICAPTLLVEWNRIQIFTGIEVKQHLTTTQWNHILLIFFFAQRRHFRNHVDILNHQRVCAGHFFIRLFLHSHSVSALLLFIYLFHRC